ncbi:MAG: hypothetical protein V3V99_05465 [candidate division Zixibacteria bacterium]
MRNFRRIRRTTHSTVEITKLPKEKFWTTRNVVSIAVPLIMVAAVYYQIEGIQDQNEAIMYSNRPIVTIKSLERKDIISTPGDQRENYEGKKLNFSIRNEGNSPAYLDLTSFMIVTGNIGERRIVDASNILSSGAMITNPYQTYLLKGQDCYIKYTVKYEWRRPNYDNIIDSAVKCYQIVKVDNQLIPRLITFKQFNEKWNMPDLIIVDSSMVDIDSTAPAD